MKIENVIKKTKKLKISKTRVAKMYFEGGINNNQTKKPLTKRKNYYFFQNI